MKSFANDMADSNQDASASVNTGDAGFKCTCEWYLTWARTGVARRVCCSHCGEPLDVQRHEHVVLHEADGKSSQPILDMTCAFDSFSCIKRFEMGQYQRIQAYSARANQHHAMTRRGHSETFFFPVASHLVMNHIVPGGLGVQEAKQLAADRHLVDLVSNLIYTGK